MRKIADKMDAKASKFREMAGAGFKMVKHYYLYTDSGKKLQRECKPLLKDLACKDKDSCIRGVRKIEVKVAVHPVNDAELTNRSLHKPNGDDRREKPLLFRPKKGDDEEVEMPAAAADTPREDATQESELDI